LKLKVVVIVSVLCSVSFFGFENLNNLTGKKWLVLPSSHLQVTGFTNINQFKCEIVNYSIPDTIFVASKAPKVQLKGDLCIGVQSFNCHNPLITRDMVSTLKGKVFPYMTIRFLSLNSNPNFQECSDIKGEVEIILAGVSKFFDISYNFDKDDQSNVLMSGVKTLSFADFNLQPPIKMGGAIKTKQTLIVEFTLKLKPLP
jgi:hypothetical protein